MNKEYLRKKCYKMGNSQLPIDVFYNDIRDNPNPNFNKDEAYVDLKKIVDYIEKLQKENQELKNTILSLELDTCIPELREENTKLKKAIEIIKEKKVDIPKLLANDFNNYNALAVFFGFKQLTQEEYILVKEVLEND